MTNNERALPHAGLYLLLLCPCAGAVEFRAGVTKRPQLALSKRRGRPVLPCAAVGFVILIVRHNKCCAGTGVYPGL